MTPQGTEKPRDATWRRDRATSRLAERPSDVTSCRGTARRHVVQKDRATLCGAEKPRDTRACRETAWCHAVQRDRATSRCAAGPHDAKARRGTAQRHEVQRICSIPRGAERPHNVTSCRRTARNAFYARKPGARSPNLRSKPEPEVVLAAILDTIGAKSREDALKRHWRNLIAGASETRLVGIPFLVPGVGPEVEFGNRKYLEKCQGECRMS